jgi:hypothetical protein
VLRRLALAATLCCLASTVWVAPAWALNVDGKLGIGLEETLTGMHARIGRTLSTNRAALPDVLASGLAIRGFVGDWGIEGIVGGGWHSPEGKPNEGSLFGAVGVLYQALRSPHVNLGAGVRLLGGLARVNQTTTTGSVQTAWRYGFAGEIPLRAEYFFSSAFSISASVGVVVAFNGADGNPLTGNTNSTDVAIAYADFSGGVGFTYYFR